MRASIPEPLAEGGRGRLREVHVDRLAFEEVLDAVLAELATDPDCL